MACGTPVVAFGIPSLREVVVPRTGLAFHVPAFGAAVADLATDEERVERMGAAGREHARRYNWDEVSERQWTIYLQAMSVPAGPGREGPR